MDPEIIGVLIPVLALSHTMLSLEQQREFTSRLLEENSGNVTQ